MKQRQGIKSKSENTGKTYYALYDTQTNRNMGTGLNATSKEELKSDLLSYLSVDHSPSELKRLGKESIEALAGMYDFRIEEQNTKFEEEYEAGGNVGNKTAELSNTHTNIMGTLSFDMKIPGMRKAQDFIVLPIDKDSKDKKITIQSDTRIGMIDLNTGKGAMSQSHSGGAYFHHLSLDKKTFFELSPLDTQELKMQIFATAGSNVGDAYITSDNSGATRILAEGGQVKKLKGYSVNFYRSRDIGSDSMNVVSNGQFRNMILVTDGINGDSSEVNSDEPYLTLRERTVRGIEHTHVIPVNIADKEWKMFGGNFIYSSDSRFRDEVSELPLPLHDRVESYKMEKGGKIENNLCIGDIYHLPYDERRFYTIIFKKEGDAGYYSYWSDKQGNPHYVQYSAGNIIHSNSWLGKEPIKVGHIDLEQATRNIGGECYTYYKSRNKNIDIELANLDNRYKAFSKNATKEQRKKYDEQEDMNYHFENAKMVADWFDNHFEKGGKTGNKNEITYKGKLITKLFPSGYYEFYSDNQGRFLKFDDLDAAKAKIDSEINSSRISMASGGMITTDRAKEIASNWHGGQNSALYQYASSGIYLPENHLKYLREVQSDMEPEYYANPGVLSKKNERELGSLKRFFEAKGTENGIGTRWEKHPQYGYMVPFITEKTVVKVRPLHLAMAVGGTIRKVKIKIPEKPYFVYATVQRELPQTVVTNKGIFPKDDIIKEFTLDSRIIMEKGGEISRQEYKMLRDKYDHLTELYMDEEDATDLTRRNELTKEIKETEAKIHRYERPELYEK